MGGDQVNTLAIVISAFIKEVLPHCEDTVRKQLSMNQKVCHSQIVNLLVSRPWTSRPSEL